MNRQSAVARYRSSERSSPTVDHTFSADAFVPYPGVEGARTFGRNCRVVGFGLVRAMQAYRESDCQQDEAGRAAFVAGYNG